MNFLRKFVVSVAVFVLSGCCGFVGVKNTEVGKDDAASSWRLGIQAYTFNRFTFYETVDKTASLGLGFVEGYSFGQRLNKEKDDVKFGHTMPRQIRNEVKKKLADSGIKLVNYYALMPNDEAVCREVFGFAKEMGIETIVAEPPIEALDMIERLCKQYKVSLAIHNHPRPSDNDYLSSRWSRYWSPDKVLAVCKDRSKWIGACADTGHWMRSGVNPVEALKKLDGRVISVHLKDLNEFGDPNAHDVVWGTGKCDVKSVLAELKRQDFRGTIMVEYEYNWENSMPEIRKCMQYFEQMRRELGQKQMW